MTEGRRAQVILLDDRKVELTIAPKLSGNDLLDLVVSYCSLKEKEYFGLAFLDDTNHYSWLQTDKRVLDHDLPRTDQGEILALHFRVQFFSESIAKLRDSVTIELFYLQAKDSVYKGEIEVDSETAFELAAYVLQAVDGDYRSDNQSREALKRLPVLPQSTLKEHPSLMFCEERILHYYKQNTGFTTGQSIVCYMQVIESLPTYGVHYYEVKDKPGLPWWLGLSYKGIGQYDQGDRVTPRKEFHWKQLQNIYYQNRKFSIEVLDTKRAITSLSGTDLHQQDQNSFDELTDALADPTTQVTVTRRTFGGSTNTVHSWYGQPSMIRSMWAMAVRQHQFYLDRKHSKEAMSADKSMSQIANDLTVSTVSLSSSQTSEHSSDDKLRDNNLKGLTKLSDKEKSSRELLAKEGEEARKEMVAALKERKAVLEDRLKEKINTLKKLCIQEAEITNILPEEYPIAPSEQRPKFQRRMSTSYRLSDKHVEEDSLNSGSHDLSRLEKEFEIQSNITAAARKLANDPNISKKVRKTRRESYKNSARRLDKIHKELNKVRLQLGLSIADSISSEVQEDLNNMGSSGRRLSFTGTLPKSLTRGRSKSRDSEEPKRSRSVPRQVIDHIRAPSLTRNDKVSAGRAPSPVIIVTQPSGKDNNANNQLSLKPTPGSKPEVNHYESILTLSQKPLNGSLLDQKPLDGSPGDRHSYGTDTSSLSSSSSRGINSRTNSEYSVSVRTANPRIMPYMYQSLQRIPKSGKKTNSGNGSAEDFRIRSGSNNSLDWERRRRKAGVDAAQHRLPPPATITDIPNSPSSPPPVYGTVPKSYFQTGRYHESPELSLPIQEAKLSSKHAVSMHNLQQAGQSESLPVYGQSADSNIAQGNPLSQSKRHSSMGNLLAAVEQDGTRELPEQGMSNMSGRQYEDQYNYTQRANMGSQPDSLRRGSHTPQQQDVGPMVARRRHHSFSSQHSNSSHSSVASHQSSQSSHQSHASSHQSHASQRSQSSQRSQQALQRPHAPQRQQAQSVPHAQTVPHAYHSSPRAHQPVHSTPVKRGGGASNGQHSSPSRDRQPDRPGYGDRSPSKSRVALNERYNDLSSSSDRVAYNNFSPAVDSNSYDEYNTGAYNERAPSNYTSSDYSGHHYVSGHGEGLYNGEYSDAQQSYNSSGYNYHDSENNIYYGQTYDPHENQIQHDGHSSNHYYADDPYGTQTAYEAQTAYDSQTPYSGSRYDQETTNAPHPAHNGDSHRFIAATDGQSNGDAHRSFTTQQSYSTSGLAIRAVSTPAIQKTSMPPQPASAYMTSTPVSRPAHPPVYGTTIAVSKVHYQPVTPMTCEPVTRKKKHHHHHIMSDSLPSLLALEDSALNVLPRPEAESSPHTEYGRGPYSPYIEDVARSGSIDEYAESFIEEDEEYDSYTDTSLEDNSRPVGKVRQGTLV